MTYSSSCGDVCSRKPEFFLCDSDGTMKIWSRRSSDGQMFDVPRLLLDVKVVVTYFFQVYCVHMGRRQSWGLGVATSRFWDWRWWGLHDVLWYPIMYTVQEYEKRTLSIVVTVKKYNDLCGDDTLSPVLCASICWTFGPHDPPVFKPRSRTHQFSNQIDAYAMLTEVM